MDPGWCQLSKSAMRQNPPEGGMRLRDPRVFRHAPAFTQDSS